MGFRTLFIEESNHLNLYLDNVKVMLNEDEFLLFPINDIQMIIIENPNLVLSVRLINKLVENNVSVVLASKDHLPMSYISACNGNFATSGMLEEQIQWSQKIKSELHKAIVEAKIKNQAKVLLLNNKKSEVFEKMISFSKEVEIGDSGNREGLAAKIYFRELYGDDFQRFQSDAINSALNYGYAILRSLITTVIISKGLLPNFGLFHKGKTNRFNLSDDIIEVFRPVVDDYVFNNISVNSEGITKDDRLGLIKLTTRRMVIDNQKQTLKNCIELYIENIISCIKNDDVSGFIYPSVIKEDGI